MTENLEVAIEREKTFLARQSIGGDEYNESLKRLMALEKQRSETAISVIHEENDAKNRKTNTVVEVLKVVANVTLPLIGYVAIVAAEKEITFTGALKDVTKCFIPKKMN